MSRKRWWGERRRRGRTSGILWAAVVVSLGAHAGLLPLLGGWVAPAPQAAPVQERVELRLKPPPEDAQFVDLPPAPEPETPPEDARFLAERNSVTPRETVAPAAPSERALGPGRPETPRPPTPAARTSRPSGRTADRPSPRPEPAPEPEPTPKVLDLRPDPATMARVLGGRGVDRLPELPQGEATRLKARRHFAAAFANRLKRLVFQTWHPLVNQEIRTHVSDWAPRPDRERVSVVGVVLDRQGNVLSVELLRSSGLGYLDRVAVQSFEDLGRVPNPPEQLLDPRGRFAFQFGFSVSFTGRRLDMIP